MKRWFAVYTRSRHEKDVAAEYAKGVIEHYLPLHRKERRWKDRKKMVDFPLFPGYLFVREDLEQDGGWEAKMRILKVRGVVKILTTMGGDPIPVPDQEVFNIRTVLEQNMKVDPYRYDFSPGQVLRIRKGPLAGVEGILVKRRGVYRLILQVHLLCQAVAVLISASDVEAMT
ncbi:MAG: transcription termination/antitermination protein NusG [Planctomycetota bacterium]